MFMKEEKLKLPFRKKSAWSHDFDYAQPTCCVLLITIKSMVALY